MENNHSIEQRLAKLEQRVHDLERNPSRAGYYQQQPVVSYETENESVHKNTVSFENFFGSRVLLRVGIVAILFAVGFFLKYAFEHQLLSDVAKVFVIAVFGGLLVGLGEYLARKHTVFGQVLIGGGIAAWFFDVVACRNFYGFISAEVALMLILLLTGAMLTYAIKRNSQPMLVVTLVGAYLAPLFVSIGSANVAREQAVYALILTIGAAWALHRIHDWAKYLVIPIIGFIVQYGGGFSDLASPEIIASVVGVEFIVMCALLARIASTKVGETMSFLLLIPQTIFLLVVSQKVSSDSSTVWMSPLMTVMCALGVLAAAWYVYVREEEKNTMFFDVASLIALLLFVVTTGNYLTDRWIIFAWLLLVIIASSAGAALSRVVIAFGSLALSIVTLLYFLFVQQGMDLMVVTKSIWVNDYIFLFVFFILVFVFQTWMASLRKHEGFDMIRISSFILAELTGLLFIVRQIGVYYQAQYPAGWFPYKYNASESVRTIVESIENKKNIAYSIALVLYGALNLIVGFVRESRALRIAGLLVLSVAIIKVAFIDLWNLGTLYRIAVSFVLGMLLIASSLLYHRYADKTK